MAVHEYTRSTGQWLVSITYDHGDYLIALDGKMKEPVPDIAIANAVPVEAKVC